MFENKKLNWLHSLIDISKTSQFFWTAMNIHDSLYNYVKIVFSSFIWFLKLVKIMSARLCWHSRHSFFFFFAIEKQNIHLIVYESAHIYSCVRVQQVWWLISTRKMCTFQKPISYKQYILCLRHLQCQNIYPQ